MNEFTKAPPWLQQLFADALAGLPAETRRMFGYPCAFVNGNMATGVFGSELWVRLGDADRAQLLSVEGAATFEPVPGRAMREYVVVPASMLEDERELRPWIERALAYAGSLPPKEPAGTKPAAGLPAAKAPVAKRPPSKRAAGQEPAAKTPVAKKPVAKKPVAKKTVEKPAAKKPAAKKPAAKKSVVKPPAKKPAANKSGVKTPVAKKSVAKNPPPKKSDGSKPAGKRPTGAAARPRR